MMALPDLLTDVRRELREQRGEGAEREAELRRRRGDGGQATDRDN